jgi:hypothetical protein
MGHYPRGNYITLAIREGRPSLLDTLISLEVDPNSRSLEGTPVPTQALAPSTRWSVPTEATRARKPPC